MVVQTHLTASENAMAFNMRLNIAFFPINDTLNNKALTLPKNASSDVEVRNSPLKMPSTYVEFASASKRENF
jgi:hypothetical protein